MSKHIQKPDEATERLIQEIFALRGIGYVAVGNEDGVVLRSAPGLVTNTSEASNFFEEVVVNPTLLKLAGQRGSIDCGGLNYIALGYGDFMQFITPTRAGHVSVGVSRKTTPAELAARLAPLLSNYQAALSE